MQCGNSLSGLDLIQAEGEGEAAGQLLDAADVRRRSVQVGSLVLQQLVEQLQHTCWQSDCWCAHESTEERVISSSGAVNVACLMSYLLKTEDEGLGTENLVRLSGFTQSLLDDVSIIIIILRQRRRPVKKMQDDCSDCWSTHLRLANLLNTVLMFFPYFSSFITLSVFSSSYLNLYPCHIAVLFHFACVNNYVKCG